jgi:hypothetical protein
LIPKIIFEALETDLKALETGFEALETSYGTLESNFEGDFSGFEEGLKSVKRVSSAGPDPRPAWVQTHCRCGSLVCWVAGSVGVSLWPTWVSGLLVCWVCRRGCLAGVDCWVAGFVGVGLWPAWIAGLLGSSAWVFGRRWSLVC